MRVLKFRQPRIAQGKFHHWHYWGYVDDKEGHFVAPLPPNTGGDSYQFTGLLDKSGKEIYEGDKIEYLHYGFRLKEKRIETVVAARTGFAPFVSPIYEDIYLNGEECKIIGNIHQKPELMEKP